MHQNVNLMNENVHRQNDLKAKQVVLLLWQFTRGTIRAFCARQRMRCRCGACCCAHRSLLLWQSEIATVQGEAGRMALKRDALVKKVISS